MSAATSPVVVTDAVKADAIAYARRAANVQTIDQNAPRWHVTFVRKDGARLAETLSYRMATTVRDDVRKRAIADRPELMAQAHRVIVRKAHPAKKPEAAS